MNRYFQISFFIVIFMLLDLIWLGMLMHHYYGQQLAGLLTIVEGSLVINGLAAIGAYVCLALGPFFFIFPYANRQTSVQWYAFRGALMGLVIYGTYNFTNKAILLQYGWPLVFVDICWGIFLYAASTAITGYFVKPK
jgi:uncharacterized membrane protein